jgi:hypothetical protein
MVQVVYGTRRVHVWQVQVQVVYGTRFVTVQGT